MPGRGEDMDRRRPGADRVSGFTAAESLLVLLILSCCLLLAVPHWKKPVNLDASAGILRSTLWREQAEAMLYGEEREVLFGIDEVNGIPVHADVDAQDIAINSRGNVQAAQTITIAGNGEEQTWVLWIGAGRMHEEE